MEGAAFIGRDDNPHNQNDRHIPASFLLKGAERMMPAGDYGVITDEELIDGLSFLAYRRVLTAIYSRFSHLSELRIIGPWFIPVSRSRTTSGS